MEQQIDLFPVHPEPAEPRQGLVDVSYLRQVALHLALTKGNVCTDDIRSWLDARRLVVKNKYVWGSIFKGGIDGHAWRELCTIKSTYPSNKGHRQLVHTAVKVATP